MINADSDLILTDGPISGPANGADAMHEYLLAYPPLPTDVRPLRQQPLFAVPGEPEITGRRASSSTRFFKTILAADYWGFLGSSYS